MHLAAAPPICWSRTTGAEKFYDPVTHALTEEKSPLSMEVI